MNDKVDKAIHTLGKGEVPDLIASHLQLYMRTGGREGHLWDSAPIGGPGLLKCLLLTSIGRKSGKTFTHPLAYGQDGDDYIIVASKGGAVTQPQWYFNLLSNPKVTVQVGTEIFNAVAVLKEGEERNRLWKLMTAIYPPYNDYQAKTSRKIPLFLLHRIPGGQLE